MDTGKTEREKRRAERGIVREHLELRLYSLNCTMPHKMHQKTFRLQTDIKKA